MMDHPLHFLPNIPEREILDALNAAAGNEVESGKLASPESSSALAVNAFGWFLRRPKALPPLPRLQAAWPAREVKLEAEMRFPWSGGRHPWLDALVITDTHLVGIESKRYEPFRPRKKGPGFSDAYDRPVWGDAMTGFCSVRDNLKNGSLRYASLDASQLVKHAFGLRSAVHRDGDPFHGLKPVLVYLFAEPRNWPDGRPVDTSRVSKHRSECEDFMRRVSDDEVRFLALDYARLVKEWDAGEDPGLALHARNLSKAFDIG